MLVLCNSMCKSASSIFCWYAEEVVYGTYPDVNGRDALRALTRSGKLDGKSHFVNLPIDEQKIEQLLALAAEHGPTVAKVHCPLTPLLREKIESGEILSTFCYRDPRDMILSAMEHRVRALKAGENLFSEFTSVDASLDIAEYLSRTACDWLESTLVPTFPYVQIVRQPELQIERLARYLNIDFFKQQILETLRRERERRRTGWYEFNGAHLARYRNEMTPVEIQRCDERLGDCIRRLGFDTSPPASVNRQTGVAQSRY